MGVLLRCYPGVPLERTWDQKLGYPQKGPGTRDWVTPVLTDRHLSKHYLLHPSDAGGKNMHGVNDQWLRKPKEAPCYFMHRVPQIAFLKINSKNCGMTWPFNLLMVRFWSITVSSSCVTLLSNSASSPCVITSSVKTMKIMLISLPK